MIYRGERLVIPKSQQRPYLTKLHSGHLEMDKCIERAKQSIYWPGMNQQIKQLVAECPICLRFSNRQQKMPLLPHEVPKLPWNKVGMDILEFKNNSYLLVVDFYFHYPELRIIKGKTAKYVTLALKSIFAVHGVPIDVVADNMPFGSMALRQFASEWGFNITTSSPRYPKSNGMAERYVQTVKQFLKKAAADESKSDIYQSLLAYRQTPVQGLPFSPSEMLFNRCIRGPLPYTRRTLKPLIPDAYPLLSERQRSPKLSSDRQARDLPPLHKGEEVVIRTDDENEWSRGQVLSKTPHTRSYMVDTGTSHLRRTRTHIKPVQSIPDETDEMTTMMNELFLMNHKT